MTALAYANLGYPWLMTKVAPPGESEYNTGTWQKIAYDDDESESISINSEETRVMELLCGEGCVILTSTVFD